MLIRVAAWLWQRRAVDTREVLYASSPATQLPAPPSHPTADWTTVRKALQRRKTVAAHTIYECGACGDRFVGVRRCESCNVFCRAVGVGGSCPECDTPVLVADLLGEGVVGIAESTAPR